MAPATREPALKWRAGAGRGADPRFLAKNTAVYAPGGGTRARGRPGGSARPGETRAAGAPRPRARRKPRRFWPETRIRPPGGRASPGAGGVASGGGAWARDAGRLGAGGPQTGDASATAPHPIRRTRTGTPHGKAPARNTRGAPQAHGEPQAGDARAAPALARIPLAPAREAGASLSRASPLAASCKPPLPVTRPPIVRRADAGGGWTRNFPDTEHGIRDFWPKTPRFTRPGGRFRPRAPRRQRATWGNAGSRRAAAPRAA